jgi:hypothetical protein
VRLAVAEGIPCVNLQLASASASASASAGGGASLSLASSQRTYKHSSLP